MRETHGYNKKNNRHPLYNVWWNMKKRCNLQSHKNYKGYGGRGIVVCDKWDNSFISFYNWAKDKWIKGLRMDRIDNDGNYEPGNCRFITPQISSCNQRLLSAANTSGYRGVSWSKTNKKWKSQTKIKGKKICLGHFDSPRLAAIAYDVAAYKLNDGRPLNFMKEGE